MTKSSLFITVLMPVYNGGPFLAEAIQSILDQTYANFELLIIDDASKDTSVRVIQSFKDKRIVFVRNEKNLGLIATLNKGLKLARGSLLARMDQDDIADPERLAVQSAMLEANPDLVGLGSALTLINVQGEVVGEQPVLREYEAVKRALTVTNPFAHPSMMFRRDIARGIGGYDDEAFATEDYDLWTRLCAVGRMINLAEPLLRYRLTPTGMSISLRIRQREGSEWIAQREWQKYGEEGPAPLEEWGKIWPYTASTALSEEESRAYANLHVLFAKAYRKRGHWGLAWQHFRASFRWSSAIQGAYFAILMFVMPYAWFAGLEDRALIFLSQSRVGK